jgi:[protein-PII] uridylyltransferase
MLDFLDIIRADARTRLTLPPGVHPSHETARYRAFLRYETHRVKLRHRQGASGLAVCHAQARVLDVLLGSLLEALERATPPAQVAAAPRHALVAIGGYGRGELNPHSDLDVMFLHDGPPISPERPPWFLEPLTGGLIYDIGLSAGPSTRTIADCVQVANQDMRSKTSLIEARLICGDAGLFGQMQKTIQARCVSGHETEYIQARLEDQAARRAKFGNAVCLQEPHIKNGCGGLRDYQNLLWMVFFKDRSRTLDDVLRHGFISETEREQLAAAYDFLLRVRNELHYHAGRSADALSKAVQPAVARNLGYAERSPSRRIERFMRDYYLQARTIYLITRTLEQRMALLRKPGALGSLGRFLTSRRAPPAHIIDGLRFDRNEICAPSEQVFREQPARLMRVFRHAQQRGLTLPPDLAQLMRAELGLIDKRFRADPHIHQTFLEILNQRGNVAPVLRAMHETGVLGTYLPAFGKLTCLVQHEFFHQFTTDEHTLVCLEKLDALSKTKEPALVFYADIFQKEIERPFILHLAVLLHDAAKATHKPNHAVNSSRIARSVARRLGLDASARETLARLIRLHLTMVQVSQRRDLDDPQEIRRFAEQVENLETLNLLTLLTLADSLGTSAGLWNGFKDTLLLTLYRRAREMLAGADEFIAAEERRRTLLLDAVAALKPAETAEDELFGHFAAMPPRYFHLCSPEEIAADLDLAHRFMRRQLSEDESPLEPVTVWRHEPDRGYSLVRVATWDRPGLFSKIAGALTAAGLNILSAEIFTRTDGIVLDTFFVTEALSGLLVNREEQERFETMLKHTLAGELDLAERIRKLAQRPTLYLPHEGERLPTVVRFDNATSDSRTILDVETEDRLGLLYTISQVLSELGVDISLAKICTAMGAASDTFYVSELGGARITNPARQRSIENGLRAAILRLK